MFSLYKTLTPRRSRIRHIKIIASDLDGTLLTDRDQLTEDTLTAIERIHDAGMHMILVSGRTDGFIRQYAERIRSKTPIISLSGALVRDGSGTVLHSTPLPHDVGQVLIQTQREYGDLILAAFTPDGICSEHYPIPVPNYLRAYPPEHRKVNSLLTCIDRTIIFTVTGSLPSVQQVAVVLSQKFGGTVERSMYQSHSDAQRYYMEIKMRGVNKGQALKVVARHYGMTIRNFAAIGDYMNDVEMCAIAGYSGAMSNGKDELKRIADFVTTKNNNENGVAEFLDHLLASRT